MSNKLTLALLPVALLAISGCSFSSRGEPGQTTVVQVVQSPGAVEEIWEEPMVDVVDVPPGLDAEGHYYRPGHQEVVEVRQGRWKYHRKQGE